MNEDVTQGTFEAAVGLDPDGRYCVAFKQYMKDGLPAFSFHLPGIFGFFWFAYRQVWLVITPFLVLTIALHFVLAEKLFLIWASVSFFASQLTGLFLGKQLYYVWVMSEIKRMRKRGMGEKDIVAVFKRKGGTITNRHVGGI